MYIYLVRHGETDWNRHRRIQGSTNMPLNDRGRAQAESTARLLARRQWNAIFTSPLSRAIETAEIIARKVGLESPTVIEAVTERNYGVAEGCTPEEIDARYPPGSEVPGRESRAEVEARVLPALVKLAEARHNESVIVVAHGGIIAALLAAVAPAVRHGRIANGSVHSFRHDEGSLTLVDFDDPIEVESDRLGGDNFEEQNELARRESAP